MKYPAEYYAVLHHLIEHGRWTNRAVGRRLAADAIRAMRRTMPPDRVRREVAHLRFICGDLPERADRQG